jgi:hypothetical protein
MFCIPLIIIGFIAPSITKLGGHASKMLGLALVIAYVSSIGAAFFASFAGYGIIPHLNIVTDVAGNRELPKQIFQLTIPQIMPVMSALVIAMFVGLAAIWNKAETFIKLLDEFQRIVISIVTKVVIPPGDLCYCGSRRTGRNGYGVPGSYCQRSWFRCQRHHPYAYHLRSPGQFWYGL